MAWKCDNCNRCCTDFAIGIEKADVARLEKLGYPPRDFVYHKNNIPHIKKKNGKCIFLSNGLCKIHIKHGFKNKSYICKRFPLNAAHRNMIVCGEFAGSFVKEKPAICKFAFNYKNRKIPSAVLLYAISKIQSVDDWYSLLTSISKSANKTISKPDIDKALKNKIKITGPQRLRLRTMLAGATSTFYPAVVKTLLKRSSVNLRFPLKRIELSFDSINKIAMPEKEKQAFFRYLSAGNGIIYKPNFPDHFLFCLYFTDSLAKQLAHNKGKKAATLPDLLNAYAMLNSRLKFC